MDANVQHDALSRRGFLALGGAGLATIGTGLVGGRAAHAETGEYPPSRDVTVRAMTYNIHAGQNANNVHDLEGIARVIEDSRPDIVGLQEVDVHWGARSGFEDQASLLARALDMSVFFAPILIYEPPAPGRPPRRFGCAVLSRHPMTYTENHEIIRLEDWVAPGFPEAVVQVRGAKVHFYGTHLDYRGDPTLRRMQVDDMLAVTSADEGQKILVGDLNAPPHAPELARLWGHFTDAWEVRGRGAGYTYASDDPVKRIDYVLCSPGVRVESVDVVETLASDHRPVVAELTLQRGR